MRVKCGREYWAFVSAYGPGSEKDKDERESFWNNLSECVERLGRNSYVVVLGDLNARVGDEVVEGVVGRYGVEGKNVSGEILVNMCSEQELVIGNTMFKKREINKYTWMRVVEGVMVDRALMDYVLVTRKVVGRLKDVHVFRGEAAGMSDHFLVEAKLEVAKEWGKIRGGCEREVVKVEELEKVEKEREYKEKVRLEYEVVKGGEERSVEQEWVFFRDSVLKIAKEVCGSRRVGGNRRRGSEWWNEEVRMVVEEKKRAFEEWLQRKNVVAYERYREKRMEVKRRVREAKRAADWRWGQRLSEKFEQNKMFWKELKEVRKGESRREEAVKDENGQVLVERDAVKRRWVGYFGGLLNVQDEREAVIVAVGGARMPLVGEENEREITEKEVLDAVNETKTGKAPGLDGCRAEMLKKGGKSMLEWLVRLFNLCFIMGVVPVEWCWA